MRKEENDESFKLDIVTIRLVQNVPLYSSEPVTSPDTAVDVIGEDIQNLNAKGQVINANLASIGSLSNAIVSPREIFKSAILSNASSIIMLHNHPSGDVKPSEEDRNITKRIGEAGELLGIRMLDHIIVGSSGDRYSFLEHDEMCYRNK